jgi:hypothetical protein
MRCQSVKIEEEGWLVPGRLVRIWSWRSESRRKLHTNQGAHGHRHSSARREDHGLRLREGGCGVKRAGVRQWIKLNPYFPNRRQPAITDQKRVFED